MVFKGYFDGGRDTHSKCITLATACGATKQWNRFNRAWKAILDAHGAIHGLHTTDAVALQGQFSKDKGWGRESVDALISDCVTVIARYIRSIRVVTLTIALDDYRRARKVNPYLPTAVSEICTTECVAFCFRQGNKIGAESFHLIFDQGEPFYGHVLDRKNNKKAVRKIPNMSKVSFLGEADARFTPGLQMADLFAWCINHNDTVSRQWHGRLHALSWDNLSLPYELLLRPKNGALETIRSWNLPQRKPT